jgi:Spy/CpxP family protein refolding chaperone
MRRRMPWILLALSVALNVSFVAGFVYTGNLLRRLQTHEGRTQWAADRLKLDPVRREQFERLAEQWRNEMRARQDKNRAELAAFWAEMLGERRDREKILKMVEQAFPAQNQALLSSVDYLIWIFDLLTPEERKALAKMIQDRSRL